MQKRLICSALAAALLTSFVPVTAFAQTAAGSTSTTVATGLAVPIAGVPARAPAVPSRGRAVLVDAASARLYMIDNGQVVDLMRSHRRQARHGYAGAAQHALVRDDQSLLECHARTDPDPYCAERASPRLFLS